MRISGRSGQALLELAVFGSLIILIAGYLFSYFYRMNNQQYVQMESFRRALQIANYGGPTTSSHGGKVTQLTVMENRHEPDLSTYFRKGSSQSTSATSSVYWTVPEVGETSGSATYYKVNDDLSDDLSSGESVNDVRTSSVSFFNENTIKQETPQGITVTRSSDLKDTITTKLLDENGNELWSVSQGLYTYTGPDGKLKYGYGKNHLNETVHRNRTWNTQGF